MAAIKLKNIFRTLILLLPFCLIGHAHAVVVDVLALYDQRIPAQYNGDFRSVVESRIDAANSYLRNSGVDIQLNLLGFEIKNFPDQTRMEVALVGNYLDPKIRLQRSKIGADIVLQFLYDKGEEGVALRSLSPLNAFAVVGAGGSGFVIAHEVGHVMGLSHSRKQGDTSGALYRFGLGHGIDNQFGTVMTYYWIYGQLAENAYKFSSPKLTCRGGNPCGVAAGSPNEADSVRALNNVKGLVANFAQRVGGNGSDAGVIESVNGLEGGYRLKSKQAPLFISSALYPRFDKRIEQHGMSLLSRSGMAVVRSVATESRYMLQFSGTNYCITGPTTSSTTSAATVSECADLPAQQLAVDALGDKYYQIKSANKCLSPRGGSTHGGSDIVWETCNQAAYQQWSLSARYDRLLD